MFNFRHVLTFVVLIACLVSPHAMAAQDQATLILKVATIAPKGHAMTQRMDEFNEEIIKATGNDVGFKIYWGGVQGDDDNVFRKIRLGQLHGGFFSGYSLGHIVPEIRVTELPYLFNNDDEVEYVRDQLKDVMSKLFEDKGFVVLGGFIDIGFMYQFYKEPVTTLDELKKIRCWVPGDDTLALAFYKSMDIQPVPLAVNDVMTSVSTNLIDSAAMTPFGAVTFRWFTRFKYMSDYPIMNVVGANIISKPIWNKISPENQKIIIEISDRYSKQQKADLKKANEESIDLLKKAGITVLHVDPNKDQAKIHYLIKAGEAARENQVGVLYSRDLMDKTLSLVDEYRKQHSEKRESPVAKTN